MENEIYNFRTELQTLGYCKTAVNNYPKYVKNLFDYTKINIEKTTEKDIKNYYDYLQTKFHFRLPRTISKHYIYSQLYAIRLYFEYLERHQIINKNPYNLKLKHPKSNPRNILTQDQIKTLYKNCKTIVERTILNLCYGCGLRRSEAQHLEIKDINFDKKLLFVRSGKGKKRRVIPLTISLANDLKNFYNYSNTYRNPTQNTYLIHSQNRPISYTQLNRIFKKLLDNTNKNSQIENISLHSLRHSIATHLLENEMPIEMVRDFLGHSSLKTTQIYTRVTQIKIK